MASKAESGEDGAGSFDHPVATVAKNAAITPIVREMCRSVTRRYLGLVEMIQPRISAGGWLAGGLRTFNGFRQHEYFAKLGLQGDYSVWESRSNTWLHGSIRVVNVLMSFTKDLQECKKQKCSKDIGSRPINRQVC